MNLEIKKLSKDILEDYLHFFDDIAFCDNPDWSRCYCNHYHIADDQLIDTITKEESRNCVIERIKSGKHNGFIAFIDDEPVGWINTDEKSNYSRLMASEVIGFDDKSKVASVVCFVVDKNQRGKGIATALLNEACHHFKELNFDYLEAYPYKSPKNPAENYHGPLQMYLKKGFVESKDLGNISVVSLSLK